jgi:hypothetical protein
MKTKHLIILIVIITLTLIILCLSLSMHKNDNAGRKIVHTNQVANTLNLITTPNTGQPPLSVGFTVGCSTCIVYTWDFGDNSGPAVPAGPTQTHIYKTAGTYYPIVAAIDKAGVTYTGQGVITVGTTQCGPPSYCANTSTAVIPQGKTPNLPAQNAVSNDPDFNTQIIRATDGNTCRGGFSIFAGENGSADVNTWNADETKILLADSGNNGCVLNFDKDNKKFSACAVNISATQFDYNNPTILYGLNKTVIKKYDLTSCSKPVVTTVYDFASDKDCGLPPTVVWSDFAGASADGQTFTAAFSAAGQGTGLKVSSYTIGKGCRVYNTLSGAISGTGVTGTISIPDRYTVHNLKSSPDGNTVAIANTSCTGPSCAGGPYLWNVATTDVKGCCPVAGAGHWSVGDKLFINASSKPFKKGQWVSRLYSNLSQITSLINPLPAIPQIVFDGHASFPNESNPIVQTTYTTPPGPITVWGQDEIMGMKPTGGPALRFGHYFNTLKSPYFSCQYAIGTVSKSGNYYMVSSDWMNTIGLDKFGKHRCDVFVYDLRTAH